MERLYLDPEDSRFDATIRIHGVGVRELMPPGYVTRQSGLGACLAILFHDPASAQLNGDLHQLEAGAMVFWAPNRPHYFGNPAREWSHSWLTFSGSRIAEDWDALHGLLERPLFLIEHTPILDHLRYILRELKEFERPDPDITSGHVRLLLREALRGCLALPRTGSRPDPVARAIRHIELNLSHPPSVDEVAKAAGLSPSRLQQLFRAATGQSVQRFMEQLRLREACYWLGHSGLTIAEVGERAGYTDPFYFSRRFSRAFGQSPAQFRKVLLHESSIKQCSQKG